MNYYSGSQQSHYISESMASNRCVYVKQSFISNQDPPPTNTTVLINPHFGKKVFINPNFNNSLNLPMPKIHINPNVLQNLPTTRPATAVPNITPKCTTVISTRTKFIRIPTTTSPVGQQLRKRRTSLHSKYKIIRSSPNIKKVSINKFKLDKRSPQKQKISINTSLKTNKKKYVYVNRFLSISTMAKNVLLKQNSTFKKPGFVNINGIVYQKSPNSLKRTSETSLNKTVRNPNSWRKTLETSLNKSARTQSLSSTYKLVRKHSSGSGTPKVKDSSRRSLVKRFKVIRSRKQSVVKVLNNNLRKCNIPCPIYRRFGKCKGKETGKCFKLHNPDQIVLCTRFLQGACLEKNCLLSHKVSAEKMPTCKYFLEGLCSRDDCQYLHVRISPKADICRDFVEGFCRKGAQCEKRHQFLCPEYEKNQSCPKKRCMYPHGNLVRKVSGSVAKKSSIKRENIKKITRKSGTTKPKVINNCPDSPKAHDRYYKESETDLEQTSENKMAKKFRNRPKLGDLPAFIPFNEST